jgi:hypothetical protein
VAFPSLQVDVDLSEPHRVGLGARPVDVFPERAAAEQVLQRLFARLLTLNRHEAFLHEPGVQVHRLAERMEAVVRDDQDRRRRIHARDDFADKLVAPAVDAFNGVAES